MNVKTRMTPSTYKNILASIKWFYRNLLSVKKLVQRFRSPEIALKPISVPSKVELQAFYRVLTKPRDRALFRIYATRGLRCSEILSLERFRDIEFQNRMLMPKKEGNASKHRWVSFYNSETEKDLLEYLKSRKDQGSRLFQ